MNYELLDFGDQRRLERFGQYVLDRPCLTADQQVKQRSELWRNADAQFKCTTKDGERWNTFDALPQPWTISHGAVTLELKPTEFGQVGVFAEQAVNWDWITGQLRRAASPVKVLNLFAYTGGSTLAAAAAGAQVTHVDAAKNVVSWARHNAHLSGLADAPIRWIVEDSATFVERERRRGNNYDAVILDPPSYGHGPQGQPWKIPRDLMPLLEGCAALTEKRRKFMLLTCHTPAYGPPELEACLNEAMAGNCQAGATARWLYLETSDGRRLPCGAAARWP